MRLRIHRGAEEIGGNCIELQEEGKSLLLDLGAPLSGDLPPERCLPDIPGLIDGTNPNLLGIVISHPHSDHYGLVSHAHPSIPVFIGEEAERLLLAASAFGQFGASFEKTINYRRVERFEVGPFRLMPYLNDHSAYDAYSFLVEAGGRTLFYSGDIRGHGWKKGAFKWLLEHGPRSVDVMLLEGTTLGREEKSPGPSETDLVETLTESMLCTPGIVLASFSGQNIDRFVTFFKAAKKARRCFVVDVYVAHLLRAIGRKTLPDPASGSLRVFLPSRSKMKIVRDRAFDIVEPYRDHRIYAEELCKRGSEIVMTFRVSMAQELENMQCLGGGSLIYSMWPGYLDRSDPNLRDWTARQGLKFEIVHTSGHANARDIERIVLAMKPKSVVPIHTIAHSKYGDLQSEIRVARNGVWMEI